MLFFIYSYLGSSGSGKQYGGISGFSALLVVLLLIIPSIQKITGLRGKGAIYFVLVATYIIHVLSYGLLNYLLNYTLESTYFNHIIIYLLYVISFFLIGFNLKPGSDSLKYLWYFLFFVMFLYLVMNIDPNRIIFSVGEESTDGVVSYQGFSRYFLGVALVIISFLEKYRYKSFIALVTAIGLFLLGSRSDLFGFLIISPFFLVDFQRSKVTIINISTAILFSLIIVIVLVGYFYQPVMGLIENNRALEIVDLSSSSSWNARSHFYYEALKDIKDNVLLGNYGGQIAVGGNVGNYSHNIISAWRQFGLLGFLLLVSICCFSLVSNFRYALKIKKPYILLGLYVNLFSLVLLLISKSVFWFFPALGWGLTLAIISSEKTDKQQVYFKPK
jgi:hypothetical protein